jgi:hypothetical protein
MVSRIGGSPLIPTPLPNRPTGPTGPTIPVPTNPPVVVQPAPWRPGGTPWMKPAYDITIPDNLGRAPRTTDVTIKAGFDGRSPDQVVDLVRGNLTNALLPANQRLVDQSIRDNHKAFTMAVSNMFVAGSPPNRFVTNLLQNSTVTVQMTLSSVQPVIIQAKGPGTPGLSWYGKGPNGDWVQIPKPKYAVVAQSQVRLSPAPGLTMEYKKWSLPALAGPLSTITEL